MSQIQVVSVVGARPQFIKAAVVSRQILQNAQLDEFLVHTGQHHDANMSDVFFDEMDIPRPNRTLGIHGLTHGAMTGRMLEALEQVLQRQKPDAVLVYGDTNSTLAGALAACKLHIPAMHVEAGLRSFDMRMPEEINRILTDRVSDVLFCPTSTAVANLQAEGFDSRKEAEILLVGDVMLDAIDFYREKARIHSRILESLELQEGSYALATLHRQENTDDLARLTALCSGLNRLHREFPVVLPLHPRTKKRLSEHGLSLDCRVISPVGYFDMLRLTANAGLVITDSGGLQKEAFCLGKYCLTTRETTEWTELVEHGWNTLVGADAEKLVSLAQSSFGRQVETDLKPYGGGDAGTKICHRLAEL